MTSDEREAIMSVISQIRQLFSHAQGRRERKVMRLADDLEKTANGNPQFSKQ